MIKLSLENEIRPQIKLILENFVPAANRFEAAGDSIREMKADMQINSLRKGQLKINESQGDS